MVIEAPLELSLREGSGEGAMMRRKMGWLLARVVAIGLVGAGCVGCSSTPSQQSGADAARDATVDSLLTASDGATATEARAEDARSDATRVRHCDSSSGCEAGEFCDFGIGCPQGVQLEGVCRPRSECPTLPAEPPPAPVCGCDDKNYGSRCVAFDQGQRVRHLGPCGTPHKNETCKQIASQYVAAITVARKCAGTPVEQACQKIADAKLGLGCGCPIRVNDDKPLTPILDAWKDTGCPDLWPGCPPADCFGPAEPSCEANGLCQAGPPGAGGP